MEVTGISTKSTNRYYYTTTDNKKDDNRIYVHRKIVEDYLGRELLYEEHVHHLDFDKSNNSFYNLLLCSRDDHIKLHAVINNIILTPLKEGNKSLADIEQPTKNDIEKTLGRELSSDEDYFSFVNNKEYLKESYVIIVHRDFKVNLISWLQLYEHKFKEVSELWHIRQIDNNLGFKPCIVCGNKIQPLNRFCSMKCIGAYNRKGNNEIREKIEHIGTITNFIPSKEELKQDITTMPMVEVGKKYGVTDNSIRKWCKKYGLSSKSRDYSDTVEYSFNKPILARHYFTGEIKRFVSLSKCSKFFDIRSNRLCEVLRNESRSYWKKDDYIFKYDDNSEWVIQPYKSLKEIGVLKTIEVAVINNNDNSVTIYGTLDATVKAIGLPTTTLARHLKNKIIFDYKHFTIMKLSTYSETLNKPNSKKIND